MESWNKVTMWVERGYMKPPEGYEFLKLFPYKPKDEDVPYFRKNKQIDYSHPINLLKRNFLRKYPEYSDSYLGENYTNYTLVEAFAEQQYNLMKEGYTEYKAFDIVETKFARTLQNEKNDRAILEDLEISNRTRSLMDVFEQREEYIQRQKVKRLDREIPEYIRSEYEKNQKLNHIINDNNNNNNEETNEIEGDMILSLNDKSNNKDYSKSYEPATYVGLNSFNLKKIKEEDNNEEIRKNNFLSRSESILRYYQAISEINDGLDTLQVKDVQRKANESGQRFKKHIRILLNKLEKYNIKLNKYGKIDYSLIKDHKTYSFVKKQEQLCTIVLLSKDIDFDIPHQKRINEIKYELLNEIQQEQDRLINIYSERKEQEKEVRQEKLESYEDLFSLNKKYGTNDINEEIKELKRKQKTKTLLSYAEWLEDQPASEQNKDLFIKDIEYKNFFFMQSNIDREIYLRELWLKNRNNRIESIIGSLSSDNKYKKDFLSINKSISNTIRSIRRQIDKYLLNNKQKPVFNHNIRFYDKEEILYDAEINFHQIKKFLSYDTNILKNDESISKRYIELMELLSRKKILENSVAKYEKPEFYNHDNRQYWDKLRGKKNVEENIENNIVDKEENEMIKYISDNFEGDNDVNTEYVAKLLESEDYIDIIESKLSVDEGNLLGREKRLKEKLLEHFESQMKEALGVENDSIDVNNKKSSKLSLRNENKYNRKKSDKLMNSKEGKKGKK